MFKTNQITELLTDKSLRLRVKILGNIDHLSPFLPVRHDPFDGFTSTSSSLAVESSLVDVPEFDFNDILITCMPDPRTVKKIVE